MSSNSGSLVAWTSLWLAGRVAFDDVIHAMSEPRVLVSVGAARSADAAPTGGRAIGIGEALVEWRQGGAPVALVLPVAGDVRGLPGPDPFRLAAFDAGEAVLSAGCALVPQLRLFGPSSAPPELRWWAYAVEPTPIEAASVAEAQYELTEAVRDSAGPLAEIASYGWTEAVREQLAEARRAGERLNLPPGFPARAVALLAQAERLASVLTIASTGVVVDRLGGITRDATLRVLAGAVRRARLAGYNAAL